MNAALLDAHNEPSVTRLEMLSKLIMWAQSQLDSKNVRFINTSMKTSVQVTYQRMVDLGSASVELSKNDTKKSSATAMFVSSQHSSQEAPMNE